tara:strand:- start:309 stop:632 length:324 start_codon:yes stop_codon:yes gene_type:complete
MKKFLFLMLSFLTLTTAVYASFPVTENLTEQSTDNQNEEAPVPAKESNSNDIDWALAAICFFFGSLGIHRFMMGDTTNGILMLLTAGGCGIWTLIDFINILSGKMSR